MASLLKEFKDKIDLIYIDPPFDVGADFTMNVPIGDETETVCKDQSTLEMVAYRDMWGKGTDSYLHMMYERLVLMRELLSERGSIARSFTSLLGPLDEAARGLILDLLLSDIPSSPVEQVSFFDPYYGNLPKKDVTWLRSQANNLKRTLIYRNGLMPLGLLSFCLGYGSQDDFPIGGIFASVQKQFARFRNPKLHKTITEICDFRNTYVAHQEADLMDREKEKKP